MTPQKNTNPRPTYPRPPPPPMPPPLRQSVPYNPGPDVRELSKWLNEEPNREINRAALARILTYLQLL